MGSKETATSSAHNATSARKTKTRSCDLTAIIQVYAEWLGSWAEGRPGWAALIRRLRHGVRPVSARSDVGLLSTTQRSSLAGARVRRAETM